MEKCYKIEDTGKGKSTQNPSIIEGETIGANKKRMQQDQTFVDERGRRKGIMKERNESSM